MRVLVTGATGFVGRWLVRELVAAGHDPIPAPPSRDLDVTEAASVAELVLSARPDAIAHLAGIAHAADAADDIATAFAVNEGGTANVLAAAADRRIPTLVSGSAEVYGLPAPADLPLREDAPLRTSTPYGRSKLAQERAALTVAAAGSIPIVVTRSFNHTGPGQRAQFVAPAIATRILEAKRSGNRDVRMGNLDVARDIGDVRDVARAYRLLVEGLVAQRIGTGSVVNVATARAVSVRELFESIARIAGADVRPRRAVELVRPDEPAVIVGDATRLADWTGWAPEIPLEQTLADLVDSLDGRSRRN